MKFYNSECFQINNDDLKIHLKKIIGNEYYFGPQPISIERKHFKELNSNDYYISKKADGQRYLLCLLTFNDKNIALFIDRKFDMFMVKFKFPKECFKDTLIDGEMITKNNQTYFLCFDCLKFSGKSLLNFCFSERIKHMQVLIKNYKHSNEDSCILYLKEFLLYKQIVPPFKDTWYDTDGYVFMPEKNEITFGTHNHFFKWKPLLENTIDFIINNDYKLCLNKNSLISKTLNNIQFTNIEKKDIIVNKIYECKYIKEKVWSPIILRHDKTIPNSYYVYQKTLINIKENIQESEFFNKNI